VKRGIPWGASLSPLLGAFHFPGPDLMMEKLEKRYLRYMDDILILAPKRWKLRKAIRVLYKTFNKSGLEQHPDKTLIGRTERDFDFLGYFLKPGILSVAKKTIKQFNNTYLPAL
jgi:RNA-directed DNA polymerase